ncbi:hypothetical protein Sbal625DRAFT_4136 [Shewanella baltica OS625]|uniref:hypothetical protein n=1 Tax=Shewanella baltica TaxID=62322 RepID=UPI000230DD4D|nr:hypothetical protein [Shewanella baltica]EHC04176.1 hypothetical protein Sbal625DRAFT_4136 [Shewanella baltica OS625]
MGIGSDLMVEFAEEDYARNLKQEIAYRAAVYVVFNKLGRMEAINVATEHVDAQHNAMANLEYADDGNVIHFFDISLNDSPVPFEFQAQVLAIQAELINLI